MLKGYECYERINTAADFKKLIIDLESGKFLQDCRNKFSDPYSSRSKFIVCLEYSSGIQLTLADIKDLLKALEGQKSPTGGLLIDSSSHANLNLNILSQAIEREMWPIDLPLFVKGELKVNNVIKKLETISKIIESTNSLSGLKLSINFEFRFNPYDSVNPSNDINISPENFSGLLKMVADNTSALIKIEINKFVRRFMGWNHQSFIAEADTKKYFIRNCILNQKQNNLIGFNEKEMQEGYYLAGLLYNDLNSKFYDSDLAFDCFQKCGEYLPALKAILPFYISPICNEEGHIENPQALAFAKQTTVSILSQEPDNQQAKAFLEREKTYKKSIEINFKIFTDNINRLTNPFNIRISSSIFEHILLQNANIDEFPASCALGESKRNPEYFFIDLDISISAVQKFVNYLNKTYGFGTAQYTPEFNQNTSGKVSQAIKVNLAIANRKILSTFESSFHTYIVDDRKKLAYQVCSNKNDPDYKGLSSIIGGSRWSSVTDRSYFAIGIPYGLKVDSGFVAATLLRTFEINEDIQISKLNAAEGQVDSILFCSFLLGVSEESAQHLVDIINNQFSNAYARVVGKKVVSEGKKNIEAQEIIIDKKILMGPIYDLMVQKLENLANVEPEYIDKFYRYTYKDIKEWFDRGAMPNDKKRIGKALLEGRIIPGQHLPYDENDHPVFYNIILFAYISLFINENVFDRIMLQHIDKIDLHAKAPPGTKNPRNGDLFDASMGYYLIKNNKIHLFRECLKAKDFQVNLIDLDNPDYSIIDALNFAGHETLIMEIFEHSHNILKDVQLILEKYNTNKLNIINKDSLLKEYAYLLDMINIYNRIGQFEVKNADDFEKFQEKKSDFFKFIELYCSINNNHISQNASVRALVRQVLFSITKLIGHFPVEMEKYLENNQYILHYIDISINKAFINTNEAYVSDYLSIGNEQTIPSFDKLKNKIYSNISNALSENIARLYIGESDSKKKSDFKYLLHKMVLDLLSIDRLAEMDKKMSHWDMADKTKTVNETYDRHLSEEIKKNIPENFEIKAFIPSSAHLDWVFTALPCTFSELTILPRPTYKGADSDRILKFDSYEIANSIYYFINNLLGSLGLSLEDEIRKNVKDLIDKFTKFRIKGIISRDSSEAQSFRIPAKYTDLIVYGMIYGYFKDKKSDEISDFPSLKILCLINLKEHIKNKKYANKCDMAMKILALPSELKEKLSIEKNCTQEEVKFALAFGLSFEKAMQNRDNSTDLGSAQSQQL